MLNQMGENGKPPELGISHVNVGNESYLQIIEKAYIDDVLIDLGGSSFKLVQGTYGAGKSHFLYCVRDMVWRRKFLAALVTLSPNECPLDKPLNVYQAVAQQLELPRTNDEEDSIRGIDDIVRATIENRLAGDESADDVRNWVRTKLARAPIDQHSFRQALTQFSLAHLDEDHEKQQRLAAWLRGESTPAAAVKKDGVFDVPNNQNGFAMLRSVVQSIVQLGYQGSVLLFDEAERRLSIDGIKLKSTRETMDHLREIVDLCGRSQLPSTLILYAVTPAFVDLLLPEYPALQQRLGSPVQYLSSRNPRAPLIDLEALDLDPKRLLQEVGARLLRVSRRAYDWSPQASVAKTNLSRLVDTVTAEQLEVSHRRQFVKLWIRLLDELRLGGDRTLEADEIRALVRDEQVELLEEDLSGVRTFFGQPIPTHDRDD